jgi:DNA-binding LacI/PurR family transcriptional regulator
LAGVDRSTVSLVLNDPQTRRITAATKQRVLDAAASIGYAPNAAASQLRAGTSRILLMPVLPLPFGPAYDALLQGIGDGADVHGRYLLIHGSRRLAGVAAARAWAQLRPEIVIADSSQLGAQAVEILTTAGTKAIVGIGGAGLPGVLDVDLGHLRAGSLAAAYLEGEGVDRFVAILPSDPSEEAVARRRLEGFEGSLDSHVVVAPAGAGGSGLADWLRSESDGAERVGVLACTEGLAANVVLAARAGGVRLPEKLVVVGIEGTSSDGALRHPFGRITCDAALLGRQIVAAAVDAVTGRDVAMPQATYRLIPAESAAEATARADVGTPSSARPRRGRTGEREVTPGRRARTARTSARAPRAGGDAQRAASVATADSAASSHLHERDHFDDVVDRVQQRRTSATKPKPRRKADDEP